MIVRIFNQSIRTVQSTAEPFIRWVYAHYLNASSINIAKACEHNVIVNAIFGDN